MMRPQLKLAKKKCRLLYVTGQKLKERLFENHLQTFFMGHATVKNLLKNLVSSAEKANLPLKNLLMVSYEGPNVSKATLKLINESVLAVHSKSLTLECIVCIKFIIQSCIALKNLNMLL